METQRTQEFTSELDVLGLIIVCLQLTPSSTRHHGNISRNTSRSTSSHALLQCTTVMYDLTPSTRASRSAICIHIPVTAAFGEQIWIPFYSRLLSSPLRSNCANGRDITANVSIFLDVSFQTEKPEFVSHAYGVTSAINLLHVVTFVSLQRPLAACSTDTD